MVTRQWVLRGVHTWLSHFRPRSLSPGGGLGGFGFWPFFLASPQELLSFPFILASVFYPSSTCRIDIPRLILVPSVHTRSGWGWLKKLENMVLSGTEY